MESERCRPSAEIDFIVLDEIGYCPEFPDGLPLYEAGVKSAPRHYEVACPDCGVEFYVRLTEGRD